LNTLLSNDQWLDTNQVTVFGYNVQDIIDLSTVSTNLSANVVGLMMMSYKCSECILANSSRNSESKHDMHLGEITVEFLLGHFVDTSHDVFV